MIEVKHVDLLSLEKCLGCAEEFHRVFDPSVPFDPVAFLNYWKWALAGDTGIFIIAEKDHKVAGGVGGVITTFQTSSVPSLVEMFWWVKPEYRGKLGLRLLSEFEREGIKRGAKRCLMALMEGSEPEKVDKIYRAKGYIPFERHYIKNFEKEG